MEYRYNDGGRIEAGYKGEANDCVCRAIAIVTSKPYQEVYDVINQFGKCEKEKINSRKTSARNGVRKSTTRKIMEHFGLKWTPTMQVGQGCKVHLKADELPSGRIIAAVSCHVVAIIDGVINDTHDCSRDENRCVYGYWR